MTDHAAIAALQGAAEALQESARSHKRAEFQHRKQAQALMRRQAELRAAAEQLGIHLDIEPKEAHSHARRDPQP